MKIAYVLYPGFTALDLVGPSGWRYGSCWATDRSRRQHASIARARPRDSTAHVAP